MKCRWSLFLIAFVLSVGVACRSSSAQQSDIGLVRAVGGPLYGPQEIRYTRLDIQTGQELSVVASYFPQHDATLDLKNGSLAELSDGSLFVPYVSDNGNGNDQYGVWMRPAPHGTQPPVLLLAGVGVANSEIFRFFFPEPGTSTSVIGLTAQTGNPYYLGFYRVDVSTGQKTFLRSFTLPYAVSYRLYTPPCGPVAWGAQVKFWCLAGGSTSNPQSYGYELNLSTGALTSLNNGGVLDASSVAPDASVSGLLYSVYSADPLIVSAISPFYAPLFSGGNDLQNGNFTLPQFVKNGLMCSSLRYGCPSSCQTVVQCVSLASGTSTSFAQWCNSLPGGCFNLSDPATNFIYVP